MSPAWYLWALALLFAHAERCSFVTVLLSEDFLACSEAWVRSVRQRSAHEVNVLALPEISANARGRLLEAGAHNVVTIEEVQNPNKVVRYQAFAKNYAIIRVWQLSSLLGTHFDKAVYMDSDMVMTQNSDDLCDAPELSAARDLGAKPVEEAAAGHIQDFNAGLMVLSPQEATFQRLLDLAPLVGSASGGVQPLLRAAFPDFNALDHLQDNVNARVYDLSRSSWDMRRIRSIHYTGPLKPCYTHAQDFAEEDWDQPMRVWHRLQDNKDSSEGISAAAFPAKDGSLTLPSAREAWKKLWPIQEESVLVRQFGFGESELQFVAAHHVCKHGSNTLAKLREQVFAAGYRQLSSCLGPGPCQPVSEVTAGIRRSVDLMQRTLPLYLQRASADAEIDAFGLGSASSALTLAAAEAAALAARSLRHLAEEEMAGEHICVFDIVMSLAKDLQRLEEVYRWRLSHLLLALLWWQLRQLREETGEALLVPASFALQLPELRFEKTCCRAGQVLAEVLRDGAKGTILLDGPLRPQIEAEMASEAPELRILDLTSALAEVPEDSALLLGCAGGAELDPEMELHHLRSRLDAFESSQVTVAGCGFVVGRPGLVEAVSQHCIKVGATLHLGVDATWWFQPPS